MRSNRFSTDRMSREITNSLPGKPLQRVSLWNEFGEGCVRGAFPKVAGSRYPPVKRRERELPAFRRSLALAGGLRRIRPTAGALWFETRVRDSQSRKELSEPPDRTLWQPGKCVFQRGECNSTVKQSETTPQPDEIDDLDHDTDDYQQHKRLRAQIEPIFVRRRKPTAPNEPTGICHCANGTDQRNSEDKRRLGGRNQPP